MNKEQLNKYKDHENNDLIRRRFYLSKVSLKYVDNLALRNNISPSKLLDKILLGIIAKEK